MIDRRRHRHAVRFLLERSPAVAILGPRQVGKSTLARQVAAEWDGPTTRFDLEAARDLARLSEPMLVLEPLRGLVVLDEIQRAPDLFPALRVLCDRDPPPARFLVLGSASPSLLRQGSETLAGRLRFVRLGGLALEEVGADAIDRLWLRGGFPSSFLAEDDEQSFGWRADFVSTFLERDLPQLGIGVPSPTMRRFWSMLAHWHGQTWNGAELARSFGVAQTTVRRYLDHLDAAMVVRVLPPWHENVSKRQVKAPKVYLSDSGLLHSLLGLREKADLEGHPKLGASWEGFVLEQIIALCAPRPEECYWWGTHTGAELDLLVVRGRHRIGFEVKRTDAPTVTRSMRSALADLGLDRLDVVHAGPDTWPLGERVRAVAASRLLTDLGAAGAA